MYVESSDIRREKIIEQVRRVAVKSQLRSLGAGTDDHMILRSFRQQFGDIFRRMLAVTIHQYNYFPARRPHAAFHGGAVADVVGMTNHAGARAEGNLRALIGGAVVDNDDFRT